MRWSENIKDPPVRIAAEDFDPRERAYPFADRGPDVEGPIEGTPYIRLGPQMVAFIGQRGPIKEVGVNGCQIDDMITFVLGTLQTFNKKFPCRENSLAITKLEEALHWLDHRKRDREDRLVEGYNKE
jgi:hypothetical protein